MGKRAQNKRFRRRMAEARLRNPDLPPPQTPEDIATRWLTRGHVPVEYCFLVNDEFCIWSPQRAELLIVCVLDGNPAESEACREYLLRSGSAFATEEEVLAEVRRRGLPGVPAGQSTPVPTADS